MKAALLIAPGEIRIDEIPEPGPGPHEVRIAVGGVGLCGSDLSIFRGTWAAPQYPWVQGHEAFGWIDAVGAGVDRSRLGEMVVVEPNMPCFRCDQCRLGRTSACRERLSLGMNRFGALVEKFVVPSANAWSLKGTAEDLVCVEPLTVVETAIRRLFDPLPDTALVVGAGSQGLLACLALAGRGPEVHAIDVNPARAAFARTLGALELERGGPIGGMALVIDTVGTPASTAVALEHVAIGGTILVLGLDAQAFELSAQTLVRRQLTIRGSLTYDHPADFGMTVDHVREGTIAPGRVITDEFPLDQAQRAFESSGRNRGKTWIRVARSA